MKGIEYITQLNGWTVTELAEKMGLGRSTVAMWFSSRKIPKKHLPKLVELFEIDAKYFDKEIDEVEKLKVQQIKLVRELEHAYKTSSGSVIMCNHKQIMNLNSDLSKL